MIDNSSKFTLLKTILLCCLQVTLAGAVFAGVTRLGQEGTPAGKRKSLHEYGPEDFHPEAQENENASPRKRQNQPRTRIATPTAAKSKELIAPETRNALAPETKSAVAPETKPLATESKGALTTETKNTVNPGPSPTPAASATPGFAPAQTAAPAITATRPSQQKVKNSDSVRRKLIISLSIFLALFGALVFFAIKMWRHVRGGDKASSEKVPQDPVLATERRQLRIVGQGASEKRVNRSEINTKNLKTKAQNERGARFKKA